MLATYRMDGLSFQYPRGWSCAADEGKGEREGDAGQTVTVSNDGTAFCTMTTLPERPTPKRVIDAAVAAYRESYGEIDVYPVKSKVAARPAEGRDIDFFCLELVNSAWLRAFRTGRFTVLVLFQAGFDEVEESRRIFESICESVECDADVTLDGPS